MSRDSAVQVLRSHFSAATLIFLALSLSQAQIVSGNIAGKRLDVFSYVSPSLDPSTNNRLFTLSFTILAKAGTTALPPIVSVPAHIRVGSASCMLAS